MGWVWLLYLCVWFVLCLIKNTGLGKTKCITDYNTIMWLCYNWIWNFSSSQNQGPGKQASRRIPCHRSTTPSSKLQHCIVTCINYKVSFQLNSHKEGRMTELGQIFLSHKETCVWLRGTQKEKAHFMKPWQGFQWHLCFNFLSFGQMPASI